MKDGGPASDTYGFPLEASERNTTTIKSSAETLKKATVEELPFHPAII